MVVYLNEYPTAILGDFEASYLELPEEILITVMRGHQKYFALRRRDGRLAPHFLAVINLDRDAKRTDVRRARARPARALRRCTFLLASRPEMSARRLPSETSRVTFQVKLGSYGEKVERVRALARWLAEQWFARGIHEARVADADRAAELRSATWSPTWFESSLNFRELSGDSTQKLKENLKKFAGRLRPLSPGRSRRSHPRNLTGRWLRLPIRWIRSSAVSLSACPTGSSDPFALRRAALGIVKIVLERKLPLSLAESIPPPRAAFRLSAKIQLTVKSRKP